MDDLELLLNIGNIILDTETYDKALMKIVSHLNRFLDSDVCSIYLHNRSRNCLTLMATKGLHQDAVGKVSMKSDEGLTGQAYSKGDYLFIQDTAKHPNFKFFPGIGEEPFKTFIGIPLKDKKENHGVLVFQFIEKKEDSLVMEKLLKTVASIVSGLVTRYNIPEIYEESEEFLNRQDLVFNGMPLSGGIAIGTPVHLIYKYIESSQDHFDPEKELNKLDMAFEKTGEELNALIDKLENSKEHISSDIFHGHLLMLKDPSYKKEMVHHITKYNKGAVFSIRYTSNKYIRQFKAIQDAYLRERAADVEDICQRLLSNLGALQKTTELQGDSIIIADRLTPGETASLDMEKVIGFVSQKDGPESHTAILARNRQIPAVSGIEALLKMTEFAKKLIVDGLQGKIIINPSETTIAEYREKQSGLEDEASKTRDLFIDDTSIRQKGIKILANVSSILDAEKASTLNADGIGLVRTEIFYLQNQARFDFETQVEIYTRILEQFKSGSVVFRLLDLGADKRLRSDFIEDNPALGLRGVRLLLKERELFKEQVQALLKVSTEGQIKILVPFITEAREFIEIKDLILQEARTLGIEPPPIGAMIEIPSAVFILEDLIQKSDFFSVGTNDLFQYFCAVDRNNVTVSHQFSPDTKSFISLLDLIYQQTKGCGKEVEICGEIAADPIQLSILLHIGFKHFSINPYSINNTRTNLINKFSNESV